VPPRRRYSGGEVAEIVKRASELEATSPTAGGAMTLGGVEALAGEVGIAPEVVRAAAQALPARAGTRAVPAEPPRAHPWLDPTTLESSAGRRVAALCSGVERHVTGVVPRSLEVRARLGYIELDLRRATFEPGLTTIDVGALMGYVAIRLPARIRVESHGRALFGFFSLKGAPAPGAEDTTSIVRITGRATFGFAECSIDSPRDTLPASIG
jgi:hypothetical protein